MKLEMKMKNNWHYRIVKRNYKWLYANKLGNLDKTDKYLETYNLPKLNQEESENLSRLITNNKNEEVIKTLPTN